MLMHIIRPEHVRAEPERWKFPLSAYTPPSVTPAHRSAPAHATSRFRSSVFFNVPLPLIQFSGSPRSTVSK